MPVIGDYILSSELSWHFCKTTTTTTTTIIHNCPFGCGCISGFLTMSLSDLSVLSSVPYCFVISLQKILNYVVCLLTLFFFHKIVLEIQSPLYFPVNFEFPQFPLISTNPLWGLIGI